MIRIKSEKVLLVAPNVFSVELLSTNKQIRHITAAGNIFPSIYQMNPNLIVFDYDYLSGDMENIIRRIRTNPYYHKIKICCYKTKAERKTDSLLTVLGVNYIIYRDDIKKPFIKHTLRQINNILDASLMNLLVTATY